MEALIGTALPALRAVHLVVLFGALGSATVRLLLGRGLATGAGGEALPGQLAICGRLCVLLAIVSGAGWFWLQGSVMAGRPIADLPTLRTIAETGFGKALLLRAALLAGAVALFRRGGWASPAALSLLVLAALLQGALGHGAATDPTTMTALGIHAAAAGLWLGCLPPLLMVCMHLPDQAPILAKRFTPLGLACVAILAATSLMQAQAFAGTLPALLGTDYGKLALVKLALFAGLLLLAAANRFRFVPKAEAGGSVSGLTLSIAAEIGLGLAIVGVAATLANQPPGIHDQPNWPFALRPVPGLWDDAYLRSGLLGLLKSICIVVALATLAVLVRRLRWAALLAGVVALAFVRIPPWRPYVVDAVPTSFQSSPTGYGARSIAAGQALFQSTCADCHGKDARGRGPMAVARSVWPPDLSAPLIAGRPDGELFWSIRHGVGAMPPAPGLDDASVWALVDFIRLRAGARAFESAEMQWGNPTRVPGFVARCRKGTILGPGSGEPLQLWIERDAAGVRAWVQAMCSAERCPVEDPEPLATALAELTRSPFPPAQVLVDANGWLRRTFRTDDEAAPTLVAGEMFRIRERPLDGTAAHHRRP
ncbi:MAG: hypothetical protein DI527_08440 [Chelatococcus sp.]|nr:MAG: hypothetical protein DI527_08440 [Chelatococcus sp.]